MSWRTPDGSGAEVLTANDWYRADVRLANGQHVRFQGPRGAVNKALRAFKYEGVSLELLPAAPEDEQRCP